MDIIISYGFNQRNDESMKTMKAQRNNFYRSFLVTITKSVAHSSQTWLWNLFSSLLDE